jgi:hypothetical protein
MLIQFPELDFHILTLALYAFSWHMCFIGTGDENGGPGKQNQHHHNHANGRNHVNCGRKNHPHPYTVNGHHEVINLVHANGHMHDLIGGAKGRSNHNVSTRATYC